MSSMARGLFSLARSEARAGRRGTPPERVTHRYYNMVSVDSTHQRALRRRQAVQAAKRDIRFFFLCVATAAGGRGGTPPNPGLPTTPAAVEVQAALSMAG